MTPRPALTADHSDAQLFAAPCDVLDKDSVANFAEKTIDRFGSVDTLINNAGQARVSKYEDTSDEAWREELDLKFFSVLRPSKAFQPYLEKSDNAAIACTSSLIARQPEPHVVATSAARAGQLSLIHSMARELAPKNIRVNSILIGVVESAQWQRRYDALPRTNLPMTTGSRNRLSPKAFRLVGLANRRKRPVLSSSWARHYRLTPQDQPSIFQEGCHAMSDKATVGEVITAFLEECGVGAAFGVISIHNMPFLDAIGRRGKIRYISARSEPGAINMADAYARVGARLGVAFTSTGTAAGNASGAMVEAQTAGTSLLHITGQIDLEHVDKEHGFIHEARDQLTMLRRFPKAPGA